MATEKFRANVGALIMKDGLVLACQRKDFPENWQCPQGGLDVGEVSQVAIWREVEEEVGLTSDSLKLLLIHPAWLSYEYPDDFKKRHGIFGQTQKWYLFEFTGSDPDIKIDDEEFSDWKWMTFVELSKKAPYFKQVVYERLAEWLKTEGI